MLGWSRWYSTPCYSVPSVFHYCYAQRHQGILMSMRCKGILLRDESSLHHSVPCRFIVSAVILLPTSRSCELSITGSDCKRRYCTVLWIFQDIPEVFGVNVEGKEYERKMVLGRRRYISQTRYLVAQAFNTTSLNLLNQTQPICYTLYIHLPQIKIPSILSVPRFHSRSYHLP